jgi:hypothetical protein
MMVVAALAVTCGLSITRAQPATQSQEYEGIRPAPPHGGPGGYGRWRLSPEEQQEALAFIEKNMPVLHGLIDEAPKNSMRHHRLMRFAVERHRLAQRLEREDPDLYEQLLERLKSQDEMFQLMKDFRLATEQRQAEIREQLRGKVRLLVEDWLDERQRRIEMLEKSLQKEARALEADRQRIDELTNDRMERMLGTLEDSAAEPTTGPSTRPWDRRDGWEPGRGPDGPRRGDRDRDRDR